MKDIVVKTIEIKEQRYNTCGDYWEDENTIQIRLTKQPDERWEEAVLIHELVEYLLCRRRGITEEEITKFDLEWEARNPDATSQDEPGNEPNAPYFKEHKFATLVEQLFARELGIDWDEYDNNLIFQQNGQNRQDINNL